MLVICFFTHVHAAPQETQGVVLSDAQLRELRGAVLLHRKGESVRAVRAYQLGSPQTANRPVYADYTTSDYETTAAYRRWSIGKCVQDAGAPWRCEADTRQAVIETKEGVRIEVPDRFPTPDALRISSFVMTQVAGNALHGDARTFGIWYEKDRLRVVIGDICSTIMDLKQVGASFEVMDPTWARFRACR